MWWICTIIVLLLSLPTILTGCFVYVVTIRMRRADDLTRQKAAAYSALAKAYEEANRVYRAILLAEAGRCVNKRGDT